jgi:very-short-patch-repair endonuclease
METRIRLVIVFAGLPVPVLQHPVGPYLLDMAYPAIRLAVEYDGQTHRTQERPP